MLHLALDCRPRKRPDLRWITTHLKKALRQIARPVGDLNVVIVDDQRIAELHEQYLGVKGTTDVITFDLNEDSPRRSNRIEGEIYICLDEARRRSKERGIAVERELLLYALHGVLHLLGYDDHDPAEHRRMHRREDALLKKIGVGPVFSLAPARGAES